MPAITEQKQEVKATATPWKVGGHPGSTAGSGWRQILAKGEFGDMYVGEALEVDAQLIVRAVNRDHLFDELVAKLRDAESFIAGFEGDELQDGIDVKLADMRALLTQAEAA